MSKEDGLVLLCCYVNNWKIFFLAFNLVSRLLDCKIRIFCRPVWATLGNVGQRTHTIWKAVKHYVEKLLLPCSSLTSMTQRSREGRGRVRRAGSESTFRLRSSERNMRTDASRGGGAWPLNCRKLSLSNRKEAFLKTCTVLRNVFLEKQNASQDVMYSHIRIVIHKTKIE